MVRIVTDSTSDITQAEGRKLGITIVPLTVHFLGESYRDGIDLSNREFFAKLAVADSIPTTSQVPARGIYAPVPAVRRRGGRCRRHLHLLGYVRYIPVGRGGARAGGRRKNLRRRFARGNLELSLLVRLAVRLRDAGKTAPEIAGTIRELTKRVRLFAVIDTLKYLKMSGRISTTTAFVGGLLGINPLISIRDGKVVSIGKSRGLKAGLGMINAHMRADPPDLDYLVGFGHINAPAFLKETVAYFSGLFGITDYFETDIGIIVGTHVGPGSAGIAYIAKEK
jgi:fatty acid-binding protein DegV